MTEPPTEHAVRLPPRGAVIHRETARVLPVRRNDRRILLLHGWDPDHPDRGFWFTVGGGIDPGEDEPTAAVREVREELGLTITSDELRGPVHRNPTEFDFSGWHLVQTQSFYALPVDDIDVSRDGMEPIELATTDRHGWFTLDELITLEADGETFADVVEAARRALAELDRMRR